MASLFDAFLDNTPVNPAVTQPEGQASPVPLPTAEAEHAAAQGEAPTVDIVDLPEELAQEVDAGTHTVSPFRKTGLDYRVTDSDQIGAGGAVEKYANNVAAIRLLKMLQIEGRMANAEEQAVLVKYSGWGWASRLFHLDNKTADERGDTEWGRNYYKGNEWLSRYQELKSLLSPEEFEAAGASTTNAHYTSDAVIRPMWDALKRLGFTGGRILEPAVGVGHFFGLMPSEIAAQSYLSAVELDPTSADW